MYAWGGPKMEAAGATLVERTGESAVMGLPGPGKIAEHMAINRRVARWLGLGLAGVHIPVDSPGANFPICKITRRAGLRIVHLVAPQVWAWGSWRTAKLRRLTDLVLCLLPFEEEWFLARNVPAKFIGHPLFDEPIDAAAAAARAAHLGKGTPKLALMPGSRPAEMTRCFPVLLNAYDRLRKDFPETTGVVAATSERTATRLREIANNRGGWPQELRLIAADTDAAVAWCDFALVVSGTVTLQIARQFKPMVAFYNPGRLKYVLAKLLVSTEMFTLPNLIAGRRVIPEFIPHFGDGEVLAVEVIKLLRRTGYADEQRENLAQVSARFRGRHAASSAADAIETVAGIVRAPAFGTDPTLVHA